MIADSVPINTFLDTQKVDVEELVREFKVMNIDVFTSYLKEIWRVKYILKNLFLGSCSKK
jgi:hypothetical protein